MVCAAALAAGTIAAIGGFSGSRPGAPARTGSAGAVTGLASSRVVARTAADFSPSGSTPVLLSPSGTSFYLCSQPFTLPRPGASRIAETARIVGYRTTTGKATGVVATFTASYVPPRGVSYYAPTVGCSSMALDPSGRFLLVPYREVPLNLEADNSGARVSAAIIDTATGARSDWTLQLDDAPNSMTVAW